MQLFTLKGPSERCDHELMLVPNMLLLTLLMLLMKTTFLPVVITRDFDGLRRLGMADPEGEQLRCDEE